MLRVNLICVGRLKERYLSDAVEEYSRRLRPLCRFEIIELPEERAADNPSDAEIAAVVNAEGDRILGRIERGDYVIAMCIEGRIISSEELSERLDAVTLTNSTVDVVIGGSWGLSDALKSRADLRLSMGRMTFPHQLCRVMVCEQVYRAFQISRGTKYHK